MNTKFEIVAMAGEEGEQQGHLVGVVTVFPCLVVSGVRVGEPRGEE